MEAKKAKRVSLAVKIVVVIVLAAIVYFMLRPVLEWFQLDKKAIDVQYHTDENGVTSFQYGGKTYYLIEEEIGFGSIPYGSLEMECIGRAKSSLVSLYVLENDPERKVIVGETPMDYCVFSCEYEALPTDGTVTGAYLHLSRPQMIEDRQRLIVEKEYYENQKLLFQRLWNNRHKYEPIIFEDRDCTSNPVSLLVLFCFDGCPLPLDNMQYHMSYYEGNWYFVEYQHYVKNQQYTSGYFAYLIDDPEMIDYLYEFTQVQPVSKENASHTKSSEISEPMPSEVQPTTQTPELTAKVPEELQTLLKDSFLAGTAAQTLQSMVSDEVIAKEDWISYQGMGVDEVLSELEIWGGTILRVDADNDNIKDLFMWILDGGSSGNTSIQLAKGKEDGTYEVTEYQGTMSQELAFVAYEGQNYLVETDFDYNRKAASGFTVTCYEQGTVSDQVYLEAVAPEWEPKLVSYESEYEKLAEQYAQLGKDGFHEDSLHDYRISAGSGERVEQKDNDTIYHADINNDGVEEWYEKHIFYPSTISSCVSLENDLYFAQAPDEPEYLTSYYDLQYEGIPLNFWVEDVADDATGQVQHVVCLLTYEGLATNWVYGYLIEGEAVRDVFEIEYQGQLEWRN